MAGAKFEYFKQSVSASYKYFDVVPGQLKKGRKTRDHVIVNRSSGTVLAMISWYSPWRQYCFYPRPDIETVWSDGCLADVKDYIEKLKRKEIL